MLGRCWLRCLGTSRALLLERPSPVNAASMYVSYLHPRSSANTHGSQIKFSQELIALGASNFIGSWFQAYPVTGSFCRTPINNKAGAQTLLSGVLAGIIVIVAIEAASDSFRYIPQASLAAIVMVAVVPLADFRVCLICALSLHSYAIQVPLQIWRVSPIDVFPYIVCFVTVLFGGVEYGIPLI